MSIGPKSPYRVHRGVPCSVNASYIGGSVSKSTDLYNNQLDEEHICHLSVLPGDDEIHLSPNPRLRVTGRADRGHVFP